VQELGDQGFYVDGFFGSKEERRLNRCFRRSSDQLIASHYLLSEDIDGHIARVLVVIVHIKNSSVPRLGFVKLQETIRRAKVF